MNFSSTQKKLNIVSKIFSKYESLINFLLFFLVLVLAYFFLVSPFYDKILIQEKEVAKKSDAFEEKEISLEQLSKLHDEFPDFSSKATLLEKILVSKNDPVQFLVQIEKLSKESNLKLSSVVPEASGNTVGARLELQGGYKDFKKFLKSLENNLLIIDVSSFTISESPEGMRFSLKVKVAE